MCEENCENFQFAWGSIHYLYLLGLGGGGGGREEGRIGRRGNELKLLSTSLDMMGLRPPEEK